MRKFLHILDNLESYICRILLSCFVVLVFVQVVSRGLFGYSFSWIEELSVYMFVWFVFFGASYAAKMNAHNRVASQLYFLPGNGKKYVEAFADLLWIGFNVYFVYLSYDFVFEKMNRFWRSQTLGIEMKYIYVVLPIAFSLMTFRILQANYLKFFKGMDMDDPDKVKVSPVEAAMASERSEETQDQVSKSETSKTDERGAMA